MWADHSRAVVGKGKDGYFRRVKGSRRDWKRQQSLCNTTRGIISLFIFFSAGTQRSTPGLFQQEK